MSDDEGKPPTVTGSINITDLLGLGAATKNLAPAATELVKAIGSGMGKVYEPASIYLNEKARGLAARQNAVSDVETFRELRARNPLIVEAMSKRVLGLEYRRTENLLAAESEAVMIAQQRGTETANPVDPDFFTEWEEGVKDVSQEDLRSVWHISWLVRRRRKGDASRSP